MIDNVSLPRALVSELAISGRREWLVANGIGGYAAGTVAGVLTRAYHGLLIAALHPPGGRLLLLTKVDETVSYRGRAFELGCDRWAGGVVDPEGHLLLDGFALEGGVPAWRFLCADAVLEKRVWMERGANTTYVRYTLAAGSGPVDLAVKAIVNHRDHHGVTSAGNWWPEQVRTGEATATVTCVPGAAPLYLAADSGRVEVDGTWHLGYDLAIEHERGLPEREDHFHAATFLATLAPGQSFTVMASADGSAWPDVQALERRRAYQRGLLASWSATRPDGGAAAPPWVRRLVLAADQFVVDRPGGDGEGKSIIAGYPWFSDWGRDTMIALPGLTLATGRAKAAGAILRTYARHVDRGMLPNRFPDTGDRPGEGEYNTADATLWFFQAVRAHHAATGDDNTLAELLPTLAQIIDWHRRGTRHGIGLDPADGLLRTGLPGSQLTWMDVRIDDWAVTPRVGKPVEVNALWHGALVAMAGFCRRLGKPDQAYVAMAEAAAGGFARFWNADLGCCFDVLDGEDGQPDPTLRPNQLIAAALPDSPLSPEERRGVVAACLRDLATPAGLRTLAPGHPDYHGACVGDRRIRDSAYHQGTAWPWLIGVLVEAHLRAYADRDAARALLEPIAAMLDADCIGSLPEICDGDPPHRPRGCFAQAWSVAEALRAATLLY